MYGTLKRQRGFTHTNVRGKENVLGEVGLMFIGYNLTRCISILGAEKLIRALREYCWPYFKHANRAFGRLFKGLVFPEDKNALFHNENILCAVTAAYNV